MKNDQSIDILTTTKAPTGTGATQMLDSQKLSQDESDTNIIHDANIKPQVVETETKPSQQMKKKGSTLKQSKRPTKQVIKKRHGAWNARMKEYKEFVGLADHGRVPFRHSSLGKW